MGPAAASKCRSAPPAGAEARLPPSAGHHVRTVRPHATGAASAATDKLHPL